MKRLKDVLERPLKEEVSEKQEETVVCPLCSSAHPLKYSTKLKANYIHCPNWAKNQIVWFRTKNALDYLRQHRRSVAK